MLLVTIYSQPRLRSLCAYKFASPTTSSNSAPDTSWFPTCTTRWFPTTHRKTMRLARPVRLVRAICDLELKNDQANAANTNEKKIPAVEEV